MQLREAQGRRDDLLVPGRIQVTYLLNEVNNFVGNETVEFALGPLEYNVDKRHKVYARISGPHEQQGPVDCLYIHTPTGKLEIEPYALYLIAFTFLLALPAAFTITGAVIWWRRRKA